MNPGKLMTVHPRLFTGLAALPSITIIIVGICLYAAAHHIERTTSTVSDWVVWITYTALPVFESIVGFTLAYVISIILEKQKWLTARHLTAVYLVLLVLLWNVVFGYLSFFVFAMGFGDGPPPATTAEFIHRAIGILCIGFPEAILISLAVCSVALAIIIAMFELIAFCLAK